MFDSEPLSPLTGVTELLTKQNRRGKKVDHRPPFQIAAASSGCSRGRRSGESKAGRRSKGQKKTAFSFFLRPPNKCKLLTSLSSLPFGRSCAMSCGSTTCLEVGKRERNKGREGVREKRIEEEGRLRWSVVNRRRRGRNEKTHGFFSAPWLNPFLCFLKSKRAPVLVDVIIILLGVLEAGWRNEV